MKISVLIAAYKAAQYLPAALDAVEQQSHTNWELIVVEDGSEDGTRELVEAFAQRVSQPVRYDNPGVNRGVAEARNRLLDLASGDALAFLDADDTWEPEHLSTLCTCLQEGHALCFSGIELWDLAGKSSLGVYQPSLAKHREPRLRLFEESIIMTSSCVALPAKTIERTGRFDATLRIGEDRDYWFRALEGGGSVGYTGQITCRYSKHSGSSMTATRRWQEDTIAFYRKHAQASDIPAKFRQGLLSKALSTHARMHMRSRPQMARDLFREALALTPLQLGLWPRWAFTQLLAFVKKDA